METTVISTGAISEQKAALVPLEQMKFNNLKVDKTNDGIVVIAIDCANNKVNKVSAAFLEEINALLDAVETDVTLRGMVLISAKKDNFLVGADIEEFRRMQSREAAHRYILKANSMLGRIDALKIPVVAAIHGSCLGGGLELALVADYRMAEDSPRTVMGLPEVQLGLFPAAGGTQWLPRLVGLTQAMPLLLTAKNVRVKTAKRIGLIDEIVFTHGLRDAAIAQARAMADKKTKIRRKRKRSILTALLESTPVGKRIVFTQARKMVMKQTHGLYPAPLAIIDSVSYGMKKGINRGIVHDCELLSRLVMTPESRSLINLFFGMTELKKNPMRDQARAVKKMAVIGSGLMGHGIASVSTDICETILMKDVSLSAVAAGMREVWKGLVKKTKAGAITPFERDTQYGKIVACEDFAYFTGTDLVIEAVFENLELKRAILKDAEDATGEKTIFASNTSALPIADIARGCRRPENVIGMHYFSPVPRMPLLEIITTDATAAWVVATANEFGIRQGKTCIVVKDGPGFYTTRILAPLLNEAVLLIEEGVDPAAIDAAMLQFGFPVGPVALLDEVGIDVGAHVTRGLGPMFKKRGMEPSESIMKLNAAGFQGKKNKKGFYRYDLKKKKGMRQVNREIYSILGVEPGKRCAVDDIQKRISLMMINEAIRCLEEGIVQSPRDGDVGAILGLGFPPFRGGPFRYVDSMGSGAALASMGEMAKRFGLRFRAADLLEDMVASGKNFYT